MPQSFSFSSEIPTRVNRGIPVMLTPTIQEICCQVRSLTTDRDVALRKS
jgi:hypothetical protein